MQSLLISCCLISMAFGANILGIVPMPGKSHNILFQRLMVSLAQAGHNVTHYTGFPQNMKIANFTEVTFGMTSEEMIKSVPINLFLLRHQSPIDKLLMMPGFGFSFCEKQIASNEFQTLLKSDSKFDVIIGECFLSESVLGLLSYHFKAPLIQFAPFQPSQWSNYLVGNIAPSSYIPDPLIGVSQRMNFLERSFSFIFGILNSLSYHFLILPPQDKLFRKYSGEDAPPLGEILKNTSLVFTNDHFSLTYPRPLVSNMIPIGGVHVPPPKKLPEDMQKHLDNSKNGAILFSMGSNLKSADMGQEKIDAFLKAFGALKQNVLWKFEVDIPNKPKNVMISNWLPQSDILAHPNIKLFITHGGLLSTTEAVDRGVPVIGIPIFADQPMNMKQSVEAGVGLSLDYDEITSEKLVEYIREIIENPKYSEAAKYRSRLLHDQPSTPIETAIFWIEYVIRHKGAKHLRSQVQNLTWYEAQQLDVVLFLSTILFATMFIIKTILRLIFRKLCGSKNNQSTASKKRN